MREFLQCIAAAELQPLRRVGGVTFEKGVMGQSARVWIVVLGCALAVASCGGGGGGGGSGSQSPAASPAAAGTTYYVDASAGNDANLGSVGSPFKTITKGLSVAVSGDTVQVNPGTYDGANNETFPITVPAGVKLLGDEPNKGVGASPTFIISGASDNLVAGGGSTVAGFKLTAGNFLTAYIAVKLNSGSGTTVRNNACVKTTGACIYIISSTNHIIRGNVLGGSGNGNQQGIVAAASASGVSGVLVENNVITYNGYGAEIDFVTGAAHSDVDFGGGAAGSTGGNTLSCNTGVDFYTNDTGLTLYFRNNAWDHASQTVGTSLSSGLDFYNGGSTSLTTPNVLDVTGGTVVGSPCP